MERGITDNKRKLVATFRGCCAVFSTYDIELKERQATKKDIEQWPQYLSKVREKFKTIE